MELNAHNETEHVLDLVQCLSCHHCVRKKPYQARAKLAPRAYHFCKALLRPPIDYQYGVVDALP